MHLPVVSMIVAMTPKGVIGINNAMPWSLKRDMDRFSELTIPNVAVMGPKTYASLPLPFRPLPDRLNIVITTNRQYKPEKGVLVAHDTRQARELAGSRGYQELFVIGGAHVYTSFMPVAEHLFVTFVDADIEGDTHFPHWNEDEWYKVYKEEVGKKKEGDMYTTRFAEYCRKQPPSQETQFNWRLPGDKAEPGYLGAEKLIASGLHKKEESTLHPDWQNYRPR